MKVLIACEESQRVCMAFREKGHDAFSCDIQECSGGHPEAHIKGETEAKKTCLWLKGLPPLMPTRQKKLNKEERTHGIRKAEFDGKKFSWNDPQTKILRSKTPLGVAKAMAEQWG